MKILVISRSPWRKDNSFGNSYSNIFNGVDDVKIANIYLADGIPEYDPQVVSYYQVSEHDMLKSIYKRNMAPVGREVSAENYAQHTIESTDDLANDKSYDGLISMAKRKRWAVLYMMRELVWRLGHINTEGILAFVENFSPDIIFLPFYYAKYVDRLCLLVKQHYNIPIVLEASSDIYSLKQISFDPFFWINRFSIRRMIRKVVNESEMMFVISEKMKKDYSKFLGLRCELLYKMPDIGRRQFEYNTIHNPIRFLFTGNIEAGRWKSLTILAESLKNIGIGRLDIYTQNPITKEIRNKLDIPNVSSIHPPISQQQVINLQNNADVLIHAESFKLANKLDVRYAISTKIMDYLSVGRCILAIGPKDVASIEYLSDSGAALIANNADDVQDIIEIIKEKPEVILKYAQKGYDFINNTLDVIQLKKEFRAQLQAIIDNYYAK